MSQPEPPIEVWERILSFLCWWEALPAALVCRDWCSLLVRILDRRGEPRFCTWQGIARASPHMHAWARACGCPPISVRSWGQKGSAAGSFSSPKGLALSGGLLYVTDSENARVQVFKADSGTYLRSIGGEPGQGEGELFRPFGIEVTEKEIFISELLGNRISVFSIEGSFVRIIGRGKDGQGGLSRPKGISFNAQQTELYVVDSLHGRVQVFTPEGEFLRKWEKDEAVSGAFRAFQNVRVSRTTDEVFVTDGQRILVYSPIGSLLRVLRGHEGYIWGTCSAGLALTPENTLLSCDYEGHQIVEVSPLDGTVVRRWGKHGVKEGQLCLPCDVVVGSNHEVFIAEEWGHRIQVFV